MRVSQLFEDRDEAIFYAMENAERRCKFYRLKNMPYSIRRRYFTMPDGEHRVQVVAEIPAQNWRIVLTIVPQGNLYKIQEL